MAFVVADRVKETTTTAGTGTVTLLGASTGYQAFSAVGNANSTYYCIAGQGTSEWEVGIGTYTSSGTTLSRDTVLASSAGGTTKVTFSAGTKDVFVTYPAEVAIYGTQPTGAIVGTTDTQTLTNKTLTNPTITNYTETNYTATVTANAITLALTNGTYQTITTMAGANAVTIPAVTGNAGKSMTVQMAYASTPTSVTFSVASSGTLKWPGGTTPTATLTNGKYDVYVFICDGTYWYGIQSGANF